MWRRLGFNTLRIVDTLQSTDPMLELRHVQHRLSSYGIRVGCATTTTTACDADSDSQPREVCSYEEGFCLGDIYTRC